MENETVFVNGEKKSGVTYQYDMYGNKLEEVSSKDGEDSGKTEYRYKYETVFWEVDESDLILN